MKRVLIASTVVLAAVLAFLVFQRFIARPPAPPAPPSAAAEAHAGPPRGEPAAAPAPTHAEARPPEAAPPGSKGEPPAPGTGEPEAKAAAKPPAVAPARPAATPAVPGAPGAKPRPRRGAEPMLPDAAASAIFADRPASAGEGGGQKAPRLPVLRKPAAGVAPPPYVVAPAPARHGPGGGPAAPTSAVAAPHPRAASTAASPTGPVQRLPGAISGLLRDAGGGSVNGAPVLAVAADGGDAFETISDDEGFYLLAGMKAGRYLVFGGLGTPRAPTFPARAVEVQDGRVARVDLRESGGGATVRARPVGADGRALPGQVLLVAGVLPSPATFAALLGSDAIFRPEAGSRDLLRHVPAGVYTMVVLQGPEAAPRVAGQAVAVRGEGEQALEVRFPAEVAAAPRR